MLIDRDTMQRMGAAIAALPSLSPYLENDWLKLIIGSAVADNPLYVILCGNIDKDKFYPTQVKQFVEDFRKDLVYRPATFVADLLAVVEAELGCPIQHRQWGANISDYDDHYDFGWIITIWADDVQFEDTYPAIYIKDVIENES